MSARRKPRYVVLGNGIAGTTAAELLREVEPDAEVTLVTDEPHPLYHRIRLPFVLAGTVSEEGLFLRARDDHATQGIRFLADTRVVGLSVPERALTTEDKDEIPFDKLLIATGGRPSRLLAKGVPAPSVHSLWSLGDTRSISSRHGSIRSALVVGGNLMGYELAAVFADWGIATTWLVRGPRLFRHDLDEAGGTLADQLARRAGVDVRYGAEPVDVPVEDGVTRGVQTRSGETFHADLVASGIGLSPNVAFLSGTGVRVGRGVTTDAYLETTVPGIFAAGDVAEFPDRFLGISSVKGSWHNARYQGALAAKNMLGAKTPHAKLPFYANHFFGATIRAFGKTTKHDPGLESVSRVNFETRTYCRLFFEAQRLVGAVLLGAVKFDARKALMEAVGDAVTVADRDHFADALHADAFYRV